jgi:hypothetical protein
VDEGIPGVLAQPAEQQALDRAARGIAVPEQPRRVHARVVDDQQVTRPQDGGQVRHRRVRPRAGTAVEHQQPRGAPLCGRRLRDQGLGQHEVEVGNKRHGASVSRPGAGVRLQCRRAGRRGDHPAATRV